jgi:cellulose biosynthesis protein BcsQ
MKVVATYSIKGGVGKTTAAVNLAYEAARRGTRVLLWDLDPQGAATFFFRVKAKVRGGAAGLVGRKGALEGHIRASDVPGLDLVPADFSLRNLDLHLDARKRPTKRIGALLEPLADRYDLAVLDCPPGITLTSESVFAAADALLVPMIPTTLAARTLRQLTKFFGDVPDAPLVLPFFSMVDRRKRLHRELLESLSATKKPTFLRTPIPNSSVVERMGERRAPVAVFAPRAAPALAFRDLWGDIAQRLWDAGDGP